MWKDFLHVLLMMTMMNYTLHLCSTFGLLIAFRESHLIFRTTCNLLKASLQMSKQLRDDKHRPKTTCSVVMEGDWTSDFPFWDLILVLFMNPYNANLKAIFPSKCTHISYTSQLKIILSKSISHARGKRPKGKGMEKEVFARIMACSSIRFPF